MSLLLILLIVFALLAAFVPAPPPMRTGLWVGAAICLILLILQALGVALPW